MIARVQVLEVRQETPTVYTVRFTKPPGFDFAPVQFVGLELDTPEGGIEYSMSLASSPTRDYLEFGARTSDTPWKQTFTTLRPGAEAEIDGPYGHFILDPTRPAVFVAGGIGITPLKGMMEYATDKRLPIPITLLYSNRTKSEIAYRAHLDLLAKTNPNLRIEHTLTRPDPTDAWDGSVGRIDAEMLRRASEGKKDPNYYLCGLPGMVQGTARMLLEMGVPRDRLVYEAFWGYE